MNQVTWSGNILGNNFGHVGKSLSTRVAFKSNDVGVGSTFSSLPLGKKMTKTTLAMTRNLRLKMVLRTQHGHGIFMAKFCDLSIRIRRFRKLNLPIGGNGASQKNEIRTNFSLSDSVRNWFESFFVSFLKPISEKISSGAEKKSGTVTIWKKFCWSCFVRQETKTPERRKILLFAALSLSLSLRSLSLRRCD